ncbi:tape measure protein [Diaphorobacter sp. HDW4A]|uniref:tape measure protein n=1 Tax=Diaphorobacter sp. HDW4A TaxID=2714924 RepID=UPI00140A752A|nr:tape measure protein [Diaphorobacter sp. HDW4A]QIL81789.1 tape measure protein [Diaphorobacter sp. HDW4A]
MEQVRQRVSQVGNAYVEMAGKARAAATTADASHQQINAGVQAVNKQLALLRNAYVGLQAAMGAINSAKGLAQTADEVSNLMARIKLAVGDGQLFDKMWSQVAETAQRTNSGLETTGTLFARITDVGKDAGLSAQKAAAQSLAIVETVNQAVQLSGSSAESSDAAITQLIQGLQSGVLRGDEFNSVMEQAPRLARALADGLGVTVGQLRAMAEEGKLSSGVVIGALKSQAKTLQQEFGSLPPTIGRSVQNLSTAWSLFVSETDKANNASQRIAGVIDLVAGNLDTLVKVAATAGKVIVGVFAARMVLAVQGYTQAVVGAAAATNTLAGANVRAATAATLLSTTLQRTGPMLRSVGYAGIADQVIKLTFALLDLKEVKERVASAQRLKVKLDEQEAQRYREITDSTGVLVTSFEEVMSAQKRGLLVQDEATGKWLSAAQAQEKLATAANKTGQELASLKTAKILKNFEELAEKGEGVEDAFKKIAQSLDFNKSEDINGLIRSLDVLQSVGRTTAKETAAAWKAAISVMDTGQLSSLLARVQLAYAEAGISADRLAQINEMVLAASFDKLGVNSAQALGKISSGAQEAINSVELISRTALAAGVSVTDAARAIEMAFVAAIPKADSLQAIDALQRELKAMGEAGKISADGIQRTQVALDKQRATIEAQIPGIQSLEEALRDLGVKPQKELDALATSAKKAFDAVKASGTATPREINQAWEAMAEAAIAANNGIADASLKAQAQQYGMVIETDKAGKSIVKSMKEAEDATKDVGDAAKASGKSLEEMAQSGWESTKDMVTQAHEQNAAMSNVESSWIDAGVAASKYSSAVAAVVWDANKGVKEMAEEHKRLVEVLETLEAQQKQMEEQGSGTAKGVDDLRMRLLELNGTEEEIALAKQQREEAEVVRQQKLMQLDLQRAQLNNNQEDIERLTQELQLLDQQLELLGAIHKEEDKQRKAKARETNESSGGGSGQQSNGSNGGGGVSTAPTSGSSIVNITLNANGISDPVKLARLVEPELAKLTRLSR